MSSRTRLLRLRAGAVSTFLPTSTFLTFECTCSLSHRVESDDDDSAQGPLSLTRAILKNRGLTPRRPKSVHNPRVKKRQKFAKAKKVIASQKPVFKPGAGDSDVVWRRANRCLDCCEPCFAFFTTYYLCTLP